MDEKNKIQTSVRIDRLGMVVTGVYEHFDQEAIAEWLEFWQGKVGREEKSDDEK